MKNFKKVLAFFAAASLLALASCEKVSQSDVLSEGNPTAKSLNLLGASPFDSIGEMHNHLLDAVGYMLKDSLDAYADSGRMTEAGICYLLQTTVERAMEGMIAEDARLSRLQQFSLYIDNEYATVNTEDIIVLDRVNMLLSGLDTTQNIPEQATFIRVQEMAMLGMMSNKTDSATAVMLNVLSHSMIYWYDALTNAHNPWFHFLNSEVTNNEDETVLTTNILGKIVDYVTEKYEKIKKHLHNMSTAQAVNLALIDARAAVGGYMAGGPLWSVVSAVVNSAVNAYIM